MRGPRGDERSIDIRDEATATQIEDGWLTFGAILFYDIGADGSSYFSQESGEDDDDGGFDESRVLRCSTPILGWATPTS